LSFSPHLACWARAMSRGDDSVRAVLTASWNNGTVTTHESTPFVSTCSQVLEKTWPLQFVVLPTPCIQLSRDGPPRSGSPQHGCCQSATTTVRAIVGRKW
jgi:hypothetical protein